MPILAISLPAWSYWAIGAVLAVPIAWLLAGRFAPPAAAPRPAPGAGTLVLLALVLYLAVQPLFSSPSESAEYPAYWWIWSAIRIVAAALACTICGAAARTPDPLGLAPPRPAWALGWAVALYLLTLPAVMLVLELGHDDEPQKIAEIVRASRGWPLRAGLGAFLLVATPILEEVVFRGLLQTALRSLGPLGAISSASVGFTLVHPSGVWPGVFVLSIVLGLVYERTRSLWSCVLVHAVHNLGQFMFIVLTEG
jgi:membrane protease YdiL (CAAX protease family)